MRQKLDSPIVRRRPWWVAAALALALTLPLRIINSILSERTAHQYGVTLSRQVASQVEGLALAANQKGIADPVSWAVFQLAQGVEPRHVQVAKEKVGAEEILSPRAGEIELRRPLMIPGRDDSQGIRITTKLPEGGFLGMTRGWARDLATLLIFGVFTLVFGMALAIRRTNEQLAMLRHQRERSLQLLDPLKDTLLATGRQVRDLFSRFEVLGESSHKSQENVARARQSLHGSIEVTRRSIKLVDEFAGYCVQAEGSALNILLQSPSRQAAIQARLLQQQIHELRSRGSALQGELRKLERELEPVTTDLDISFHAINHSKEAIRSVPSDISRAGELMNRQGQVFQELKAASIK